MKKILLLSVFVMAFAWANAQVTYTVNVPAGTNTCYIANAVDGFSSHREMTKVTPTQYTLTIPTATTAHKYKYCSGPTWAYEEKQADCTSGVADRTYAALDVVACWAAVYVPGIPKVDIVIKVKVPATWTTPKVHYWGDKSSNWPGVDLVKQGDWWTITFDQVNVMNIIFHNGSGDQTANIEGVNASTCYQVNADKSFAVVSCITSATTSTNEHKLIRSIPSGIQVVLDRASDVVLYSAQGSLLKEMRAAQTVSFNNLSAGIYIVNVNGKSHKAIVK